MATQDEIDLQEEEIMQYVLMMSKMEADNEVAPTTQKEEVRKEAYREQAYREQDYTFDEDQEEELMREAILRSLQLSENIDKEETDDEKLSSVTELHENEHTPCYTYGTDNLLSNQTIDDTQRSDLYQVDEKPVATTSSTKFEHNLSEPSNCVHTKSTTEPNVVVSAPLSSSRPKRRGLARKTAPSSASASASSPRKHEGAEPVKICPPKTSLPMTLNTGKRRGLSRKKNVVPNAPVLTKQLSKLELNSITNVQRGRIQMSKNLSVRMISMLEDSGHNSSENVDSSSEELISEESNQQVINESSQEENTKISPSDSSSQTENNLPPSAAPVTRKQRLARKQEQIDEMSKSIKNIAPVSEPGSDLARSTAPSTRKAPLARKQEQIDKLSNPTRNAASASTPARTHQTPPQRENALLSPPSISPQSGNAASASTPARTRQTPPQRENALLSPPSISPQPGDNLTPSTAPLTRKERLARKQHQIDKMSNPSRNTVSPSTPAAREPRIRTTKPRQISGGSTQPGDNFQPQPGDNFVPSTTSSNRKERLARKQQQIDRQSKATTSASTPVARENDTCASAQPGDSFALTQGRRTTPTTSAESSSRAGMPNSTFSETSTAATQRPPDTQVARDAFIKAQHKRQPLHDDDERPGAHIVTGRAVGDIPQWVRQGAAARNRTSEPSVRSESLNESHNEGNNSNEALVSAVAVNEAEVIVYAEVVDSKKPPPIEETCSSNIDDSNHAKSDKKAGFKFFMKSLNRFSAPDKKSKHSRNGGEADTGMDRTTQTQISRAIETGLINVFIKPVNKGELTDIYFAGKGPNIEGPDNVAIKVVKSISGKDQGQGSNFFSADEESEIEIHAKNEYECLKKASQAGVNVPKVFSVKSNIIFMSFIGTLDGLSAPTLREIDIRKGNKKWKCLYDQTIEAIRILYSYGNLVHGSLNERNILVTPETSTTGTVSGLEIVLIDFGRAVDSNQPLSPYLLREDLKKIHTFFSKKAGIRVMSVDDSFRMVSASGVGFNYSNKPNELKDPDNGSS